MGVRGLDHVCSWLFFLTSSPLPVGEEGVSFSQREKVQDEEEVRSSRRMGVLQTYFKDNTFGLKAGAIIQSRRLESCEMAMEIGGQIP